MWSKEWTEGEYNDLDIKKLGQILIELIKDNDGTYIGKLEDIAKYAGYSINEDGKVENYGGIYKAMQEVKLKYNIKTKSRGKRGNEYFLKIGEDITEENNLKDSCTAIKTIINITNTEIITGEEAIEIIKVLKKLI